MRIRFHRSAWLLPPLALLALVAPAPASAQWGYPAPPWRYAAAESNIRIRVTPADASVYVDGYLAGTVADFDGRLQRLRVVPGEHEVVIWMRGYRSLRQQLYIQPNATRTIDGALARLAAGEPDEPEPQPSPRNGDEAGRFEDDPRMPPYPGVPREPGRPVSPASPPEPVPSVVPHERAAAPSTSRFAVLSFSVEPGGAELVVDGRTHDGPDGRERVLVQVPEGHHVIEVRRRGYEPFRRELDVRRGDTVPVTVVLQRR